MGRKENCWDNAVIKHFFLSLKMECVWQQDYANHAEAADDIANYIVGFYGRPGLHSTLGYVSPAMYELHREKQPILVSGNFGPLQPSPAEREGRGAVRRILLIKKPFVRAFVLGNYFGRTPKYVGGDP